MTYQYYSFYWSPEGRLLTTILADSVRAAKAEFKRRYPRHARHMGEVYWTITA